MATNGASLDPIYNRLSGVEPYHPLTADTFSDWSMEAGDIIRVTRDGKNYDSPVHSSSLSWRGQPQISVTSGGNETRENISRQTKRKYARGGSGIRNDGFLHQSLQNVYNGLSSYFEVTESRMYAAFYGMYDGLSGSFEVTRSRMYADFYGIYDGLRSSFEVTRSRMYVDFYGQYDGLRSAFEVTRSRMYADFYGIYDGLRSSFEVTRSRMYADFYGIYDGLSSAFEVTRSRMHADFYGAYDGLRSAFEVTRSKMAADFYGIYDGLRSAFEVTRSRMYADFYGIYDGLRSSFEVTRSRMYADFYGLYDGLSSNFEVTRSRMYVDFYGIYDGLKSSFEVTRSRMYVDFYGTYDGLRSSFEVTRSRMYADFYGIYDGLKSSFEVTRSRMYVDFYGTYDGLRSSFEVTRSRMYADFYGTYDGLRSAFEVTRSRMAADFYGIYDGLRGAFEVTRSRMHADFYGIYDGLRSNFEVTRSQLRADFYGAYDGLRSSFQVTRSQLRADFYGAYDGLRGAFEFTRSRMAADFVDAYRGLSSSFEVTASALTSQFYNTYSQLSSRIQQTASTIGLVVEGTGNNAHIKPAAIQAGINAATGQSKIELSADNIVLDGTSFASYFGSETLTLQDVNIYSGADIGIGNDATITVGSDCSFLYGSTYHSLDDCVVNAEVTDSNTVTLTQLDGSTFTITKSGNNLVFTDRNGDTLSFSKAATLTAKGTWSSGVYTVSETSAAAGGVSLPISTTLGKRGESWSGNECTVSIGEEDPISGNMMPIGLSVKVDASGRYTAGRNDTKVSSSFSWEHAAEYTSGEDNTLTVTTDAPNPVSGASKSLKLCLTQDSSWTGNKKNVYLRTGSTSGNKMAAIEVDASGVIPAVTAGATLSYDSTTHKYTATGYAYADGTEEDSDTDTESTAEGYNDGWTGCFNDVGLAFNDTTDTISAQAYSSSSASSKTDKSICVVNVSVSGPTVVQDGDYKKFRCRGTATVTQNGEDKITKTTAYSYSDAITITEENPFANTSSSYQTVKAKCGTTELASHNVTFPWLYDGNGSSISSGSTLSSGDTVSLKKGTTTFGTWNVPSSSGTHTVTGFDTTAAPASYTYRIDSNTTISNNNSGYSISESGNYAYIVVKGTWQCDGVSKEGYNYLSGAPTNIYNAGKLVGWQKYYDKWRYPTEGTNESMTINWPTKSTYDAAWDSGPSMTFTLSMDSSYVYLKSGSKTYARKTNTSYKSGWNDACTGTNLAFYYNQSYSGGELYQGIKVRYPVTNNGGGYTAQTVGYWLVDDGNGTVDLLLGTENGYTSSSESVASISYSSGGGGGEQHSRIGTTGYTSWTCSIQTLGDEKHYTLSMTIPKSKSIAGLTNGSSYELYK